MHIEPGCPFCLDNNLFDGEILAQSDAAFMVRPTGSEVNLLVIPKAHVESPVQLPANWWQSFAELLQQAPGLPPSYNVSLNYGRPAGQSQSHLHFWVIGRVENEPASGIGLAKLIRLYNESQCNT